MTLNRSEDFNYEGDISNFIFSNGPFSKTNKHVDENKITQSRFKKFEESLIQKCKKSKDGFFNAVLLEAYFESKPDKNLNDFVYDDDDDDDDDDNVDDDDELEFFFTMMKS